MAKQHKIVRSDDATTVIIGGDKRNPEPTHLIVQFPGGYVEIARCQDGSYWVHTHRNTEACQATDKVPGAVIGSRVDWSPEFAAERQIPQLPAQEEIRGMSLRIAVSSEQGEG